MDYYLQILVFLTVFGTIIVLAFYTTRFVALKAGSMMRGKHIRIIDVVSLGADKKLFLVKAGNKFFLLSSWGKNLQFISVINDIDESVFKYDSYKESLGKSNDFKFNLNKLRRLINKNYEKGDEYQDNST